MGSSSSSSSKVFAGLHYCDKPSCIAGAGSFVSSTHLELTTPFEDEDEDDDEYENEIKL
jgi:hypothetical protein